MLKNRCVYVYVIRNNGEFIPYYVGKGSINRPFQKHGTVMVPKDHSDIRILGYNMSDVDARQAEILLVALYKRVCEGGTLVNLSEGGEGEAGTTPNRERAAMKLDIQFWQRNSDFELVKTRDGFWVGNKYPTVYNHRNRQWSKPMTVASSEVIRERRARNYENKRKRESKYREKFEREAAHRVEIQRATIENRRQLEEQKIREANVRYDAFFTRNEI